MFLQTLPKSPSQVPGQAIYFFPLSSSERRDSVFASFFQNSVPPFLKALSSASKRATSAFSGPEILEGSLLDGVMVVQYSTVRATGTMGPERSLFSWATGTGQERNRALLDKAKPEIQSGHGGVGRVTTSQGEENSLFHYLLNNQSSVFHHLPSHTIFLNSPRFFLLHKDPLKLQPPWPRSPRIYPNHQYPPESTNDCTQSPYQPHPLPPTNIQQHQAC
ncbi:hypothetical protein BKA65DRAFT_478113 [Rhexocercosporidium sp. MPI-PUGE-AT-0058]|nr:hypothetical protein BKA65DRAFT_478113 [Rhexocercosporidium sp. MPI-PUGE-AT-0058]